MVNMANTSVGKKYAQANFRCSFLERGSCERNSSYMHGKMNFPLPRFLESGWKLRPVAHSWMFSAPSWRPSWGLMGKTKLYFLFVVIGPVVNHKCNLFCFKVKGKKSSWVSSLVFKNQNSICFSWLLPMDKLGSRESFMWSWATGLGVPPLCEALC